MRHTNHETAGQRDRVNNSDRVTGEQYNETTSRISIGGWWNNDVPFSHPRWRTLLRLYGDLWQARHIQIIDAEPVPFLEALLAAAEPDRARRNQ